MFRKISLLFFLITLFSCYHENKEVISEPHKLLSKEQMVDILTDLQLSEGILTYRRIEKLPVKNYGESLYSKVIEEHHLTREQLQENIDYYNNNPKVMEKIYDEVLARLNKMQTELSLQAAKLDSIQKFKSDSIRIHDSILRTPLISLAPIQKKDALFVMTDSFVNWNYQKPVKIPDFIY
jgi:hypothetical protein